MGGIYGVLDAISAFFTFGNGGNGLTGCVSAGTEDSCLLTGSVPTLDHFTPNSTPATNYPYTDPDRPAAVWHIYGVANCDGSLDGLTWQSNFGEITAQLNAQGTYDLSISYRFEDNVSANPDVIRVRIFNSSHVSQTDAANFSRSDVAGIREITLYPPGASTLTNPQDVCTSGPVLTVSSIESTPNAQTDAVVGVPMRFSVPLARVRQCDGVTAAEEGNTLDAIFIVDSIEQIAEIDWEAGEYFILATYSDPGNQRVFFEVTDSARSRSGSASAPPLEFYVRTIGNAGSPPANIVGPSSGHVGEEITFTCASADESRYSYAWTFIDPDTPLPGATVPFTFESEGTYQVRLTVVDLDDSSLQTTITQNITIVAPGVEVPNLSITALPSVHQGEDFTMRVDSPDPNFTYSWDMGGGTILTGEGVTYHYTSTGSKQVILTATSVAHPSVHFIAPPFNIYVIAPSNPVPNLSITAPDYARAGDSVHIQVAFPDESNFSYSINLGAGDASGIALDQAFATPGTYSITMTARSLTDPTVFYTSPPRYITIGSAAAPQPSLAISHNPAAPARGAGYSFDFNAGDSYATGGATVMTYQIWYGDGSHEENSTGIFHHVYANPGAGNHGARTITLRITDSYGQVNTLSTQLDVWGD